MSGWGLGPSTQPNKISDLSGSQCFSGQTERAIRHWDWNHGLKGKEDSGRAGSRSAHWDCVIGLVRIGKTPG